MTDAERSKLAEGRLPFGHLLEQSPTSCTSYEQAPLIDDRTPCRGRTLTTPSTRGRLDPNRGRCAPLVDHPDVPRAPLVDRSRRSSLTDCRSPKSPSRSAARSARRNNSWSPPRSPRASCRSSRRSSRPSCRSSRRSSLTDCRSPKSPSRSAARSARRNNSWSPPRSPRASCRSSRRSSRPLADVPL